MTGCPECDWHGPSLPSRLLPDDDESRDLHRAWHDLARALHFPELIDWMIRLRDRHPRAER